MVSLVPGLPNDPGQGPRQLEAQQCELGQQVEMQHQEDARRAATELGAKETPEAMDNAPLEITEPLNAVAELGAREKAPQLVFAKIPNSQHVMERTQVNPMDHVIELGRTNSMAGLLSV
ncbi:hypothetical protein C8J56DRAFT_893789 [Mycena floridula]|nr:hypothetical protein C8J56DRAFT_893789 [Mycena floridula]